jgi:hypothetical protein
MDESQWKQMDITIRQSENFRRNFEMLRDYVKHEDNLINQRTSTGNSVQMLLAALFGYIALHADAKKLVIDFEPLRSFRYIEFVEGIYNPGAICLIICLFGICLSWSTYNEVCAAYKAIHSLQEKWDVNRLNLGSALMNNELNANSYERFFPHLVQGFETPKSGGPLPTTRSIMRMWLVFWGILTGWIVIRWIIEFINTLAPRVST